MTQIQELQRDFQRVWAQFTNKYNYDPFSGFIIPQDHKIQSFDFSTLQGILENLSQLNNNGGIIQAAQEFSKIQLIQNPNYKDMIILHDASYMIIQSYYLEKLKREKQQEIKIPANLAQLLYKSSKYLQCDLGILVGFQFNWKTNQKRYLKDPFDLCYQEAKLKWCFTKESDQETYFFLVSILASFFLFQAFKSLYFANYLVKNAPWKQEQIIKSMQLAEQYWRKTNEEVTKIISMASSYFYPKLRSFIGGFTNLYFEGVDKRVSGIRGNGGFDPLYQLIDGIMGIDFKCVPSLESFRTSLRQGMAKVHAQSIDFVARNSQLRQYCQLSDDLKQVYNKIVDAEICFARLHDQLLLKYLKPFIPNIETNPTFSFMFKKIQALEQNILNRDE